MCGRSGHNLAQYKGKPHKAKINPNTIFVVGLTRKLKKKKTREINLNVLIRSKSNVYF